MKNTYFKILIVLLCGLLTTTTLRAQETDNEDLLNMSLEELMDIQVVNVSKINFDNLSEVPSAVTLITADQIMKSGAKNMEEVLRNVPGFDVIRTGFDPSTNIGIRGLYSTNGTNNKILFLIDDHPVRSVFYGDATVFIGNYPIENIKQIEIIRGPGSTLFGAGAFLGVINIRTKKPDNIASISTFTGSFDTYNLNAQVTKEFSEDVNLTLIADHFTTNGQNQKLGSDFASESLDLFGRLFGYTGASTSASTLELNYGRISTSFNLNAKFKDFYLLGNYSKSEDQVPIGPYDALVRNTTVTNKAKYLETGFRKKTRNKNGELLLKAYLDDYDYSYDGQLWAHEASPLFNHLVGITYATNPDLAGITPIFWQQGEAREQHKGARNSVIGGELNFAYSFKGNVNLLVGSMLERSTLNEITSRDNGTYLSRTMSLDGRTYQRNEAFGAMLDVNDDYSWIQKKSRDIYAVFGQADINVKSIFKFYNIDHLKVIAGARYDSYSDVGGSLNPRFAIMYAPNEHFYFKGLYGKAFRAPSFVELYIQNNPLFISDSELKPESVKTYEIVSGYRFNRILDVNLTYFKTEITDNIQLRQDDDPSTFASIYINAGNIETSGLEAEFRYEFNKDAFVMGSFTYQEVLDVTETDSVFAYDQVNNITYSSEQTDYNPGRSPSLILNLTGNYPVTKNISLNTSINYLNQRKRSQAKAYEIDGATFLPTGNLTKADDRDPIEARTVMNASVLLSNLKFAPDLSLQMTVYNVLNADSYNPTLFLRNSDLLREGRHWGARLRYNF